MRETLGSNPGTEAPNIAPTESVLMEGATWGKVALLEVSRMFYILLSIFIVVVGSAIYMAIFDADFRHGG
jgi:hypothetical protein